MSETTRSIVFLAAIVVSALLAYFYFLRPFMSQQPKVQKVIYANSTWSVTMQAYEMTGPISAETFRISNDNGKTSMFYAATNHRGTVTKEFSVPLVGPEGTFLFEQLRADGVWELDDRPVRPNPKSEYIIEVDQTLGDEGGTRSFGFSDPEYWATTHAQEFRLTLPKKGSISGSSAPTVGVAGRKLQDDRYLRIVQEIRHFGPTSVLAAEARIKAELVQSSGSALSSQ